LEGLIELKNNFNIRKFDLRMKLSEKNSTKVPRIKLEILKNKNQNKKPNI
jgi:hypothetical protein